MRVSIDHSTKTKGLIFKVTHHLVSLTVNFTEEEKAIIKQRRIADTIVLERDCPSDRLPPAPDDEREHQFDLRIWHLEKGVPDVYALATPLEAKNYEVELIEKLKVLKEYIMENKEVEEKSTAFEL